MRAFMNLLNEEQVLDEMPIQHFQTIGDFSKGSSFHKPEDMKLVNNPKAIAKVHKRFAACDLDFNFYFVNTKEVRQHVEVGMVNEPWLEKNMPQAWSEIQPSISDNAINIIFTNNRGDERYPMTAWIIAHRLGHALRRDQSSGSFRVHWSFDDLEKVFRKHTREILAHYNIQPQTGYGSYRGGSEYNKFARNLFHAIGTMKSARDGNLRNADEFIYEMIAQYIFSGRVTMNNVRGIYSHSTWGHKQHRHPRSDSHDDLDYAVQRFAEEMNAYIEQLLHSCVGGIFVM
jgi:hypothetical protein